MKTVYALEILLFFFLLSTSTANYACSTCGCTLNSDWASQGYAFGPGFRFDLRFDYYDQDQLRTGTGRVDTGRITFPTSREIQLETINRSLNFDLGYSPNADWDLDLQIPTSDRTHSTIAEGDTSPSYSKSAGLGDLRIQARYQGFLLDHSFGLQFGFKLPTGPYSDDFSSGPQAGTSLDRGLQLGSGTTDLLFGIYKFGELASDWGYFAQAAAQIPLDSKDGFRPGNQLNASAGVRYTAAARVTPQIQLNLRAEKPEAGLNADAQNSGATLIYISPGLTALLGRRLYLFAFVQVPVYQRVTGYQLEPRYLISAGLHYRF